MRRIHFVEPMTSTPFQEGPRRNGLKLEGMEIVDTPEAADVICARRMGEVLEHAGLGRALFVWTHEPVYCSTEARQIQDVTTGVTVHVSTTYNGEIYLSPLQYFPFVRIDRQALLDSQPGRPKMSSILATYRAKFDRCIAGRNVDIAEYRQRMALHLHGRDPNCDIYGRSWPQGTAVVEDSRGAGWQARKLSVLEDYVFNICCENTLWENYVTEKIWQAIQAGAIPIYLRRGSGLEPHVGAGSCIDPRDFPDFDSLYDHMAGMSPALRREMLASALDDYQRIFDTVRRADLDAAMLGRFVDRLHEIS